jgi:protein-S-isoprenylcysteine O-methyltransferase Ste14
VRHPTNPGAILRVSGAWLFLSLFNGILADVALYFLLVVRITGEENMLIWEQLGYAQYQKKRRPEVFVFGDRTFSSFYHVS